MACAVHAGQHREALSLEEGLGAGRNPPGDSAAEGSSLGRDTRSHLDLPLTRVKGSHACLDAGDPVRDSRRGHRATGQAIVLLGVTDMKLNLLCEER